MASTKKQKMDPADYIMPLSINGLEGRMLHIPSSGTAHTNRDILYVYGHHSTLERWWGLMQVLTEYGSVTMPDLPGFGGMDSFYKIGRKPTLDALADYLAAFIKWRYKRKKLVIVGLSFGFVVATRMLQRYPELTDKVEMLISIVGFAHHQDFSFSKPRFIMYRSLCAFFSRHPAAWFYRHVALSAPVLRFAYARTHNARHKFKNVTSREEFDAQMDVEIKLWHLNDVRTHMYTALQFFKLDNCKVRVDLPVWHVMTENDHFFDHVVVEQHMRVIFNDFHGSTISMPSHAPSVIADAEMAAPFIPEDIRRALSGLK